LSSMAGGSKRGSGKAASDSKKKAQKQGVSSAAGDHDAAAAPKARGKARSSKGKAQWRASCSDPGLDEELAVLGLRIKAINADGNCFFRALGDQLTVRAFYGYNWALHAGGRGAWRALTAPGQRWRYHCMQGNEGMHVELRGRVVDYIREHRDEFAPFVEDDESIDGYVSRMRKVRGPQGPVSLVTRRSFSSVYRSKQRRCDAPKHHICSFSQSLPVSDVVAAWRPAHRMVCGLATSSLWRPPSVCASI
jgi:hypothetical protein